jgi:hypothetical protein
VILVIVAAAVLAVVLLGLIVTLGRPRSASDESERFRFVSDLTSQWSRQQRAAAAPGNAPDAIDLRDPASRPADRTGSADRP